MTIVFERSDGQFMGLELQHVLAREDTHTQWTQWLPIRVGILVGAGVREQKHVNTLNDS